MAQAGVRGWGLAAGVPLPPISSRLPSRALTSTQETRRAAFALTSGFAPCSPERDQTPHCLEHPIPRKGRRDVTCKPLAQVHPPPPEMPRSRRPKKAPITSPACPHRRVSSRQCGSGQILEVNVSKQNTPKSARMCPGLSPEPPGAASLLTLSLTTWGIFTPLRKHLIWGIPLPAATGWKERKH